MKDAATAVAKAEAAKGNMSNAEIEKAINDSAKFSMHLDFIVSNFRPYFTKRIC